MSRNSLLYKFFNKLFGTTIPHKYNEKSHKHTNYLLYNRMLIVDQDHQQKMIFIRTNFIRKVMKIDQFFTHLVNNNELTRHSMTNS